MRAKQSVSAVLLFALASSPVWAASATSEGAKAIAQGYADYFSQDVLDKGFVSVTPQGDDYLVTWDLQKIVDLAKPPTGALTVDKYSYLLTLTGEDSWTVKSEHFPTIKFDVATDTGKMAGTIDTNGFHLDTAYDGKLPQFLLSTTLATLLSAKIKVMDKSGPGDIDVSEADLAIETKATTSEAGVDFSMKQSIKNLSETVMVPQDAKEGDPVKISFTTGAGTSDATFAALKAREIGDLWRYVVAHREDAKPPPELRTRVSATLPVWSDFRATAEIRDLAADVAVPMTPIHADMKAFSETIALSGLTAHSFAEFGLKITDFSTRFSLLPLWAESVQPASFDIDFKITVDGMDEVARLALNDPNFGDKGDLSGETQNKIRQVLLKGHPKLVIAPGRFAIPVLEITYEGEVTSEGDRPAGQFTVTSNSLDGTQALIQRIAEELPDAQKGLLVLAFVKGLATTGSDGRLVWKIEVKGDGAVTINGNPMPTGK